MKRTPLATYLTDLHIRERHNLDPSAPGPRPGNYSRKRLAAEMGAMLEVVRVLGMVEHEVVEEHGRTYLRRCVEMEEEAQQVA